MKIYIVTVGVYSDYSISAVFLDKGKAESYAKYHGSSYGGARVEEHETADDAYAPPAFGYYQVSQNFRLSADGEIGEIFSFLEDVSPYVELTASETEPRSDLSVWGKDRPDWCVYLHRSYRESSFSKEQAIERFRKASHDLMAQLKQLRIDGATPEQAAEALGLAFR